MAGNGKETDYYKKGNKLQDVNFLEIWGQN
ncbi:hypothetical protein FHR29_001802 [Sphingobacterium sp. JUb56]|nr:hypothetical protein [Sphingobacterium sp. JUb56]